ncbi:hypothetical protein HHI36_014295 [Cryptolaemus montrouzieri]|uniref:Uncharacterized protein n=1 Tax=Cryptolaemus montrouzieri TaxID=559131 RepID=A0ABD2N238_9CUCU
MWSICCEIQGTATKSDKCALQGDSFDVGNEYNTFLTELIPELLKSLDDLPFPYDGVNNRKFMFLGPVTANEVVDIISKIETKFSSGDDEVPTGIIEFCGNGNKDILSYTINCSFECGIFSRPVRTSGYRTTF